jgi:hypothetical protein
MSAVAVPAPHEAGREPVVPRLLRLARRGLLIALALGLAWLLVAAEWAREGTTDCRHRGYRDPVTGRQVERPCPPA